jgi:hypothetical protein
LQGWLEEAKARLRPDHRKRALDDSEKIVLQLGQ